jgi:hypothetical protein
MSAYNAVSRESMIIKIRDKRLYRTMGYSFKFYQCVTKNLGNALSSLK